MPVAVGLYLPFTLGVAIFIGSILNSVSRKLRRGKNESTNDIGVLGAAGLITGEALMGIGFAFMIVTGSSNTSFALLTPSIGFAFMIVTGVSLKVGLTSNSLGLILLLAIAYWLARLGKK
ncbi:OPT/YSL family transporter [Acetomicrobium sp. UBA5826]|uniref:OPT/YSL family transporter n=1 Tax=Acetomicrobium sp. UBA5826 TaxID=1946039 RepID=UPI00257CF50E|nr:OPT/YSL family transporter [Acetomicrobium sp. UBA5826]